ncbi:MAG: PQQ-binding-like beta-propeller repeat protein [Pirellulaceae bacterium]|nr:PQQ-binding-like beta-propeller repeat protein [Pirellulaceae bacterium]
MVRGFHLAWLLWPFFSVATSFVVADEWLTYRHDQHRSGVSSEELPTGPLTRVWQWQSPLPPVSAWPDAARWDAYAKLEGMRSMRDYDSAFQPVVSQGKLLLASNSDDSLRCFDLVSGATVWTFTTGGPIRVAPTIANGKAYFGSDDGCVYAVEVEDGSLLWKRRLVEADCFVNDGRLCSFQPVRTGVLLDESRSTLIAGAGVFPWRPSLLCALQTDSGELAWKQDLGLGYTIEGPLLLGEEHVVSPQGRAPPQLFARADGKPVGALAGGGGSFALLTEQNEVLHGPGNKAGWLTGSRLDSREHFASFENGISMVVHHGVAYLLDPKGVTAIDRSAQQPIWKIALRAGEELILAGSTLFVGGDGYVAAISAESGELQWASPLLGRGRGLAAAQGHLVVSTDRGQLAVFAHAPSDTLASNASVNNKNWIELTSYQSLPVSVEEPATTATPPQESPQETLTHAAPVRGEDQFALDGLHMEFIQPTTAQIQWATEQPTTCRLVILSGSAQAENATVNESNANEATQEPRQRHRWLIRDVDQREVVRFCIEQQQGSSWLKSAEYQCDGHFDYARTLLPKPEPGPRYSAAAAMMKAIPWTNSRGIAVVVQDNTDSYTAEALCHESGLDVVVLLEGEAQVQQLRKTLLERKLYGRPISVHSLADLPKIPDNCLNMIWFNVDGKESSTLLSTDWAEDAFTALERCLAPGGLYISARKQNRTHPETKGYIDISPAAAGGQQLAVHRKPRLEGSAGWTHMYGMADNTAFAGETLGGATYADQLQVIWAGRPGPRYQSDRGNRKPSPLASNGRLYLQGHHRLLGLDAHNGTILWAKEMPKMVRFNVPRDCSNWCCDSHAVYVAVEDSCLKIDGATGEQLAEFTALPNDCGPMNWGFVSRQDDLLIGSSVAPSAAFTGYWGNEFWYDAKDGENAKKVASDTLFAVDSETGVERWRYDSALVINPTIAISDEKIVFAECRSERLRDAQSRRLDGDELWDNLFIVALDKHTGKLQWESPAKPLAGVSAMYGVSTRDQYLLETSAEGEFAVYSLALDSGEMQWRGKYGWESDNHGKHLSRPAIVGDKIYLRPLTLDRTSGKVLSKTFPVGHQCGTYTCTSNAIFLRAGNLSMWDGNSIDATRWERLRPDCWISTIPAEGMLLSPEGGGGCSCGGWIETSVGFGTRMQP